MMEKTKLKLIVYFTIAYLIVFTFNAILKKNYEFLFYTMIISVLIYAIVVHYKKMHLTNWIICGISFFILLHFLGGNVYIKGTRLYDFWLIYKFFKFDNLVHLVGGFVATFIVYNFIRLHLDRNFKHNKVLFSVLLILVVSGGGAINEIIELIAVVFLNAAAQIGDYMNNALDLVFNLLGSIGACLLIMIKYHNNNKSIKK